jgi:hypothetical protein
MVASGPFPLTKMRCDCEADAPRDNEGHAEATLGDIRILRRGKRLRDLGAHVRREGLELGGDIFAEAFLDSLQARFVVLVFLEEETHLVTQGYVRPTVE